MTVLLSQVDLSGSVCHLYQCFKCCDCLLFVPLLESVYFTPVDLETLNFKSMRQDLKKFSAFLQMGKGKSQGSLKLFPWYVSQPSGACNPAF